MNAGPSGGPVPLAGVRAPERRRFLDVDGVRLAISEWGDEHGSPVVLAHGGGDTARTFDLLAPLLADQGYRLVCWDQRGHGDSAFTTFYGWPADAREAMVVIQDLRSGAVPVVGHSKGAMVLTMLADARPDLVSHLVSIDGFPTEVDAAEGFRSTTAARLAARRVWLDEHRNGIRTRRPATLDALAARRAKISSRLSVDWLRHIAEAVADQSPDGWRWKGDPALQQFLYNPTDLESPLHGMPGLPMPVLAILGLIIEVPAMGSTIGHASRFLPPHAELLAYADSGHFVHVEHPARVADAIVDFLGRHRLNTNAAGATRAGRRS